MSDLVTVDVWLFARSEHTFFFLVLMLLSVTAAKFFTHITLVLRNTVSK
jgi:hypothetical protein